MCRCVRVHAPIPRVAACAILLLVASSHPPDASAAPHGAWTPIGPPLSGYDSFSIYDPVRQQWLAGNWAFDCAGGDGWRWLPNIGLGNPGFVSVLFDSHRDRLLGLTGTGELWTLDLDEMQPWEPRQTLRQHALQGLLVYDSVQDRILEIRHDGTVRQLPLGTGLIWSTLEVTGTLPAAASHAVFDSTLNAVAVMVPVEIPTPAFGDYHDDLWKLTLGASPTWTFMAREGSLDATGESVVLDPIRHRILVIGGFVLVDDPSFPNGPVVYQTYSRVSAADLAGSSSSFVGLPSMPYPRVGHIAAYDPARDRVLVSGGQWKDRSAGDLCCFSDVEQFSASTNAWSDEEAGWEFRGSHATWDPSRGEFLRAAWTNPYPYPAEVTFAFGGVVTQLHDHRGRLRTFLSLSRTGGHGIFDPSGDRFVMLEGSARCNVVTGPPGEGHAIQVFSRADSTSFYAVEAGTIPPILHSANVMLDGPRHRMLVFGGLQFEPQGSCDPPPEWVTDVRALSLDDTWTWQTLATSGGGPPVGAQMFSLVDPTRDRLIAWEPGSTRAWLLPLATLEWSHVDVPGPATFHHRAAYDSRRDRLVTLDDEANLWALPLAGAPAWALLETAGPGPPPPTVADDILEYDAAADRLYVAEGGSESVPFYTGVERAGLRAFDFTGIVGVDPPAPAGRPGLGLRLVSANPTRIAPLVELTLPAPGRATLEVVDVASRVVWRRALGPLGPGVHRVRAGDGAQLAPGLYFVRLTRVGESRSVKVILFR